MLNTVLISASIFLCVYSSYLILSSTKGREGGEFLSYNPPELVQPTEGHLHTGGVCSHAGRPRKSLDQKPGQSQRLWENF
jgi:hypothetical protein